MATILDSFISQGFLQEQFGYQCVDSGFNPGVRGVDLKGELLLTLNKPHLWPIPVTVDQWSEDDLFDVIEFFFDNVSKPVERHFHSWDHCGWHASRFDTPAGKAEFLDKVKRPLAAYDKGFQLSTAGEVIATPDPGLAPLLATPVPSSDRENVVDRINAAIRKFQHHRASLETQRDAVRDLAAVLEFLRPRLKTVLTTKDDADLFTIANGFGIRHHNEDQRDGYDKAVWYPWVFQFYLATIHAGLRLIKQAEERSA